MTSFPRFVLFQRFSVQSPKGAQKSFKVVKLYEPPFSWGIRVGAKKCPGRARGGGGKFYSYYKKTTNVESTF